MKRLTIIPMILVGFSAMAATTPTVRNMTYGGVEGARNIQYRPPFHGELYFGLRGALNFANFSNDQTLYYADTTTDSASESFSFEQTMGFGAQIGYQFAPRWRVELDWEYDGKFEDSDNSATFEMSSNRIMLNAIWTMAEWDTTHAYLGLGGGIAMVETRLSSLYFVDDGNDTQNATTYAGQLIVGIEENINDHFSINAEYRLGYHGGMTNTRYEIDPTLDRFEAEIGGVLTNSIMLGVRLRI